MKSMRSELLVKSTIQDKEVAAHRRQLAQSKSVQELSKIGSLSEFPIPGKLERFFSVSRESVSANQR